MKRSLIVCTVKRVGDVHRRHVKPGPFFRSSKRIATSLFRDHGSLLGNVCGVMTSLEAALKVLSKNCKCRPGLRIIAVEDDTSRRSVPYKISGAKKVQVSPEVVLATSLLTV